jgi:hypothetical protein
MNEVSEWLASLESAAAGYANKTANYITGKLVAFRDARGALDWNYRKLKLNPPAITAPAQLKTIYAATLASAESARDKAAWVGKIADQFTAITGLGALPALIAGVPVALLIAAAVAVTIIISNVTQAVARYMGAKLVGEAAERAGKDSGAAITDYYAKNIATGFFGDAASLIWPVAIVAGAYLLLKGKR